LHFIKIILTRFSSPSDLIEQFFLVLNVAVGGVGYFPNDATNPGGKPWTNQSPTVIFPKRRSSNR